MNNYEQAVQWFREFDAILIVAGAGMSADSGIMTYRDKEGLWTKSLNVGGREVKFTELSSAKMWKEDPGLAWGFKAYFWKKMHNLKPHDGYQYLLRWLNRAKKPWFVCQTSLYMKKIQRKYSNNSL